MTLRVRGINYCLQECNSDSSLPTLILLHGFMGSSGSFDFLVPYLRDINTIRIDLLGHGNTGKASSASRFQTKEQLADLKQLLDRISSPSYYLYGYSMGGRLALRFALHSPCNLNGLILESTHEGITDEQERKDRRNIDKRWARHITQDYNDFLQWWQQLDLFESTASIPRSRNQRYRNIQSAQDPKQMAMSLRGFGQGSTLPVEHKLDSLDLPVLLGSGQDDPTYVKRMSHMQKQMKYANHRIVHKAAHRIHLDAPELWSAYILQFIYDNEG